MAAIDETLVPLSAVRLTDLAYERIRGMILTGKIAMGERLFEAQLARTFGISRAPVREAVRRLIEEGLLQEQSRIGATVTNLSGDDIVDIYNARLPLEAAATQMATHNRMAIAPLRQAISDMRRAAEKQDRLSVTVAELAFHTAIFEAAQNPVMLHIFHVLKGRVMLAMLLDNAAFGTLDEVADEHLPLVELIERGDADGAARFMLGHIVSSVRPLIERLGGDAMRLRVPNFL